MKPLYTQAEFDAAKAIHLLPLECEQCTKPFLKPKRRIQAALKERDAHTCRFCGERCQALAQVTTVSIQCHQCGNPTQKKLAEFKRNKHHFCSQSCAAKYRNAHKTTGTRVSKLERWLQGQLVLLFPDLEFHFNRRDAIEAELDIYIPAIRLAFELNGIFHYEPIYGPEKLGQMQNNDERKMQACIERSLELCVIDISSVSYFKPAKAQRFLDIISGLIRSKLSGDLPAFSAVA